MTDLLVFGIYTVAVLAIGRLASGRIHNSEDFHLCGRSLGRFPAALSLAATEFNGSGLVGGAGLAYAIGVAGIWWNITAVPAWIVAGVVVAVQLRRLALFTVPGYLGGIYGVPTQRLVAVLQMSSSIMFAAVQIQVSALALAALFGMDPLYGAFLITAVFFAYTIMGGLWAVVWTDVLQYLILMTGVIVACVVSVNLAGGIEGLRAMPAESWDPGRIGLMEPLAWLALGVYSYSTDQVYMQRAFASKDPDVARFAFIFTGLNYVVFAICVAGIGMAASILLPGLAQQEMALPQLISTVLPEGLRAFLLTAILATTMSTASACLAASSSLLIRDLYEPMIGRSAADSDRFVLRDSRVSTFFIAAAALAIAVAYPGVINLIVFSTLVAPAAFFLPLIFSLYCRHTDTRAGFWAILVTAATGVVSHLYIYKHWDGILGQVHPLFLGPLVGLVVIGVPTMLKLSRRPAAEAPKMPGM